MEDFNVPRPWKWQFLYVQFVEGMKDPTTTLLTLPYPTTFLVPRLFLLNSRDSLGSLGGSLREVYEGDKKICLVDII